MKEEDKKEEEERKLEGKRFRKVDVDEVNVDDEVDVDGTGL